VSFLRSINSGKEEQIHKLAADIHKAFDANNDGIVGKSILSILIEGINEIIL
jgi:hypothetical protein